MARPRIWQHHRVQVLGANVFEQSKSLFDLGLRKVVEMASCWIWYALPLKDGISLVKPETERPGWTIEYFWFNRRIGLKGVVI
jgi:hypothetical protein